MPADQQPVAVWRQVPHEELEDGGLVHGAPRGSWPPSSTRTGPSSSDVSAAVSRPGSLIGSAPSCWLRHGKLSVGIPTLATRPWSSAEHRSLDATHAGSPHASSPSSSHEPCGATRMRWRGYLCSPAADSLMAQSMPLRSVPDRRSATERKPCSARFEPLPPQARRPRCIAAAPGRGRARGRSLSHRRHQPLPRRGRSARLARSSGRRRRGLPLARADPPAGR